MITATRRPIVILPANKAVCRRCGVIRSVNESRPPQPLCQDCVDVEADLAATPTVHRTVCGTLTGYKAHYRNGEPKCAECLTVMREYRRARRAAGRAA